MIEGLTPIVNTNSGCDYHRVILPLHYMDIPLDKFNNKSPEETSKIIANTKAFIFNRTPEFGLLKLLEVKKKTGCKIIVDVDDFWDLYVNHHQYINWKNSHMASQIVQCIEAADAVFVTNNILYQRVKQFNKNVYVIPNGLPFDDGQFNNSKVDSDKTRVLYAGGLSHFWDLRSMMISLQRFAKENHPDLEFRLAGPDDSKDGQAIEKIFTCSGALKNYIRQGARGLDDYMDQYSTGDIALAPLANNFFNRHKSNLKILEAGCKNIPIICSKYEPYTDPIDSIFVKHAEQSMDWYRQIMYYKKNPNARIDDGLKLGEYVRQFYDLRNINKIREDVIQNLIK